MVLRTLLVGIFICSFFPCSLLAKQVDLERPISCPMLKADLVVFNADILTSDIDYPYAQAVAVKDGRIVYVGGNRFITDFIGFGTEVINGRGRLVTPGFVDNHCHVLWIGGMSYLQPPELFDCEDMEQILAKVKERAEKNPDLPLIGAIGWRMEQLPNGPKREILDEIVSDRPVMLMSYSGQAGWLNSKAIALMEERNPKAFELLSPVRNPDTGECTGECRRYHVINFLDYFTWEELGPRVEQGIMDEMTRILNEALSYGVTTMNDVQIYPQFIPLILKFRDRSGLNNVRVRGSYFIGNERMEDVKQLKKDLREWKKLGASESGAHLVLGDSVKLYIDGTVDNHTAFMLEPYADDPSTTGIPDWTQEAFNGVIQIVDALRLQACTHACGDAGAHRVINAYEYALNSNGRRDARHRIEHCELPIMEDQQRMGQLGILASMQPQHFFGDQMLEKGLGTERLQRLMPWRSLDEAGVHLSFGTDWAAGPINPAYGLLIAANRLNYKGETDWGPEEAVPVEEAIRYWTIGSAHALMMEKEIGSLKPGKYADFVIFNTDLRIFDSLSTYAVDLESLDDLVDVTVVGGRKVYEKPQNLHSNQLLNE